jgi:hypothetical protein
MPPQDLTCRDTLILVAPDCGAEKATVPQPRGDAPTVASIQYELLSSHPYQFTQPEVLFESFVRRQGLTAAEIKRERCELWERFFSKSQACLRASPLPKTYGWGIHFNHEGKAALVARESRQYAAFAKAPKGGPELVFAMRNKRIAKARDESR